MTAFESQFSACPAAAPEEEAVLDAEAEPLADEDFEELPVDDVVPEEVLLPEAELPEAELEPVADAMPELAVAPWLNDVGVDAALQVPAVFAAQQAALPSESVPQ